MSPSRKPRVTVRDVRRVNRAVLLRALFMEGPLNRTDLGEMTGLSSASITNVVTELLEEGLIAEAGTEESDGGRPRVLLRVNPSFGGVVGIKISDQEISVELFDLSMRALSRRAVSMRLADHPVGFVVHRLIAETKAVLADFTDRSQRLIGVGVAVPGAVENGPDSLVHAPKIGWADVPLAELLRRSLGLPVLVDNDAKALGQAEMWFGAGRGTRDAMIASIEDGVGAALFTGGSLYHGFASSAGEWGHMCIVVGGRKCRCGGRGCLEAYVGAHSLIERWAETDRRLRDATPADAEMWIRRLVTTEVATPAAAMLLEETATYLGIAAANVVNLINPERIVIGGWAGLLLGPSVLERMRQVISEQALAYPAHRVSVELGQFGKDADELAAATLVIAEFLTGGGRFDRTPATRGAGLRPKLTLSNELDVLGGVVRNRQ